MWEGNEHMTWKKRTILVLIIFICCHMCVVSSICNDKREKKEGKCDSKWQVVWVTFKWATCFYFTCEHLNNTTVPEVKWRKTYSFHPNNTFQHIQPNNISTTLFETVCTTMSPSPHRHTYSTSHIKLFKVLNALSAHAQESKRTCIQGVKGAQVADLLFSFASIFKQVLLFS